MNMKDEYDDLKSRERINEEAIRMRRFVDMNGQIEENDEKLQWLYMERDAIRNAIQKAEQILNILIDYGVYKTQLKILDECRMHPLMEEKDDRKAG